MKEILHQNTGIKIIFYYANFTICVCVSVCEEEGIFGCKFYVNARLTLKQSTTAITGTAHVCTSEHRRASSQESSRDTIHVKPCMCNVYTIRTVNQINAGPAKIFSEASE